MNALKQMNLAMDYTEEHLSGEIDFKILSQTACCSEYHFRRMFSFLARMSLSEYIRQRRLSVAATELRGAKSKVIDIAMKYGYDSPDSFTRAFQAFHGVTPTEARQSNVVLKAFPPMTFQLTIKGGNEMDYNIIEKETFFWALKSKLH